ncbi:DNA-processing protein DprA [Deinococcus puniceus]|uniref:DNA-binding protein n=1 Tax=Deinococcus puniceus TaxID=1182568 RepID=A0A172T617_9DEIO|nr:DNA-processing protein DprA [Deinococcus puniceus]ANE42479.1 DNA-binding protein [Deinococcus puniceus]
MNPTSSSSPASEQAEELFALLTLRLTPQLGPRRIENLRQRFGSARAALSMPLTELRHTPGLDAKSLAGIGTAKPAQQAEAELGKLEQGGVTLLGRGLPGYPAALDSLGDPPAVLWVLGPLPELPTVPRAVGVVGTRSASPHALALTRKIAADLARSDVIVISGLARGIDTAAHTASTEAGGLSIGILGSAVNMIYPQENTALASKLTLISEYPLGTGPATHHFPIRNRLIAALSAATLVVEGEWKSGSLITATHALECGRTVFAVPGLAGDPRAAGPHRLIRDGAVLTENVQDILNEMGWGQARTAPLPDLPPDQARVLAALNAPSTLDDLQARTGLGLPELQTALVMLQLQGLAEEVGGRWVRR